MNISVVIPTYNRYIFLKRAIASVVSQTYKVGEIIVIDDGSDDQTSNIQNEFPQIEYFFQKNKGVSSARNLGIQKAKYEWIAFLDSDDSWDKKKIEKQVLFHQNNPNLYMSYTDEKWIRDEKELKVPKKYQKFGGFIFEQCISHCIIAPSSSLLHRSLFQKVGVFDESLEVCEDYDLWLRIAISYEIGLINEKLITKYAGHNDQLSFKHWGMDRFRVKSLEKFLESDKKVSVKATLLKKYEVLLKGARKHNLDDNVKTYIGKIQMLKEYT